MKSTRSALYGCALVAFGIIAPAFAQEDADVLPTGIRRARVVSIFADAVTDKYNSNGQLEGLANSLNRSVTINDFIAKNPKLGDLVNALNSLQPGLGTSLGNTNLYAGSELSVRQIIPAFEIGLSKKATYGIRVPVVTRNSRNYFRADSINNAQAIYSQLGNVSPEIANGTLAFGQQAFNTQFFESSVFTSKGYEPPRDFSKTEIGDVETGLKYRYYENQWVGLATQFGVRIPTGSTASMENIFDKGSGGGSWVNSIAAFNDFKPFKFKGLNFGTALKGLYYYPDTRARAVPKDANDSLPSLLPEDGQVQNTTRSPGIEWQGEVSTTLLLDENRYSFWTALQHATKGEDTYSGPGSLYYRGLATNTNFKKTNLELGTGISSIPWFRKKEFPFPGRLYLYYNTTLSGVNTPLVSYVRTELQLFF